MHWTFLLYLYFTQNHFFSHATVSMSIHIISISRSAANLVGQTASLLPQSVHSIPGDVVPDRSTPFHISFRTDIISSSCGPTQVTIMISYHLPGCGQIMGLRASSLLSILPKRGVVPAL